MVCVAEEPIVCGDHLRPGIDCQLPAGHKRDDPDLDRHVHERKVEDFYPRTIVHSWPVIVW